MLKDGIRLLALPSQFRRVSTKYHKGLFRMEVSVHQVISANTSGVIQGEGVRSRPYLDLGDSTVRA